MKLKLHSLTSSAFSRKPENRPFYSVSHFNVITLILFRGCCQCQALPIFPVWLSVFSSFWRVKHLCLNWKTENVADAVLLEGLKITGVWLRLKLLTFTWRNPSRFLKWLDIMHFKVKYVNPLKNVTFKWLQVCILTVVEILQIPGVPFQLWKSRSFAKTAF